MKATDRAGRGILPALLGALAAAPLAALTTALAAGSAELLARAGLLTVVTVGLVPAAALLALALESAVRLARANSPEARRLLLLAGPVLLASWIGLSALARDVMIRWSEQSLVVGAVSAAGSGFFWFVGRAVVVRGAARLARMGRAPSWHAVLAALLLSVLVAPVVLVQLGDPSGGVGTLSLLGVLGRAELELGPVRDFALLGLLLTVGAVMLARAGLRASGACALVALAMGGVFISQAMYASPRTALSIERRATLARVALVPLARLSDGDGDGSSAYFGGGDCDDANSAVHPGARDIPENGVDEDCRGGDAPKTAEPESPPPQGVPSSVTTGSPASAALVPEGANVLLLTIDTLRWDLGYARPPGSAPRLSPHLDALAAKATVFERAYALASYTSKSLGPLLIGRYPSETKRTFEHFDRFDPSQPFIAERAQKAGVFTLSVQGHWYFFLPGYGYERGFDVLDKAAAPRVIAVDGDRTVNGHLVADRLIDQLAAVPEGKRFFAWAHWVDPHSEYMPHEGIDFGADPRARYDGEVAFVDAQVGRVLAALEASPHARKTIVIVTSDHGEAFGEHGMIRHGFEVWEELARVPLLVFVPGAPPRRIAARRSGIDVAPTIVEALALSQPEGADTMRGRSLLDDVRLPEDALAEDRPVFVDMPEGPNNRERQAFYDGRHKLVVSAGRVLGLYDLEADPGEKNDLSSDDALTGPLLDRLSSFLGGLEPLKPKR